MTATRPTSYTQEIGDEICRRLSEGSPLRRILRDAGMPARGTVRRWQRERPEFAAAYASAREDLIEALAEDALERADYETADHEAADHETADGATAAPDAATRKIYIDTVKWYVGLLAPRKAPVAEQGEDPAAVGESIEQGRARVRRLRDRDATDS
jgi:hypothetical protein